MCSIKKIKEFKFILLNIGKANLTGFTLIELIVSTFIIGLISTIFMANYHYGGQVGKVSMEAQKLVSDIRRAQSYTLGLKEFKGIRPDGGWGVYFNKQGGNEYKYIIFADYGDGSGGSNNQKYNNDSGFDETFQTVDLSNNIEISDIKIDNASKNILHLTFEPPDPAIYICDNVGSCGNEAEIILTDVDGNTKTVLVNIFGLVDVEN